jgi:hypothetical protein
MAIFSFNHDSFGKTTNRAGAAGGNAAYNSRESETRLDRGQDGTAAGNAAYNARAEVTYAVRSHVIPVDPKEAEAWFREQEKNDRKNARMSDRFIGALPRELTPEQCVEAVERFCRDVTQDRVPWHFALHLELDKRDDRDWNPHAHIIIRDRDIETDRRYLHTSAGPKERVKLAEKGLHAWTTKDFRVEWERQMNHALERAGVEARVDHRSLKEQGIDREPQIHIGPGSQKAAEKGHEFASRDRQAGDRTIPYSLLDQGSRAEHNQRIVDANREAAAGRGEPGHDPEMIRLREAQAAERREMYKEQKADRDALRLAQERQRDEHKAWAKELYAGARKAAYKEVEEQTADSWIAAQAIPDSREREKAIAALKAEQKQLYQIASVARIAEARPQKNEAWQALRESQLQERAELRAAHRDEYAAMTRAHIAEQKALAQQLRAQDSMRDPNALAELAAKMERRHAERLQQQTNRIAAGMTNHAGMPLQHKAAVQTIGLRHRAEQGPSPFLEPREAGRSFTAIAAAEGGRRRDLRTSLNARRQANRSLATPNREQGPRRTPDRRRGDQASRANQIRQTVQAVNVTSEQRANASPELRELLAAYDHKAARRSAIMEAVSNRQQQGRGGHNGGGRGR